MKNVDNKKRKSPDSIIKSTDFEIEGKGDGSVVKTPPNEDFCR